MPRSSAVRGMGIPIANEAALQLRIKVGASYPLDGIELYRLAAELSVTGRA
jgi:hypothetical protein